MNFITIILVLSSINSILLAQDIRYIDEVFENVNKIEDVVYGNAPDLPFWFWFEWNL